MAMVLNGFLITILYSTSLSKIFMVDGFGRMLLKQHFGDREKIMEAKETVMSLGSISSIKDRVTSMMLDLGVTNAEYQIATKQAEISFKAGIKEVVDWVDSFIPSQYRKEELWQARVKEWLGENK
jgi:hypothetical protein